VASNMADVLEAMCHPEMISVLCQLNGSSGLAVEARAALKSPACVNERNSSGTNCQK